jgi:hypothetical protein
LRFQLAFTLFLANILIIHSGTEKFQSQNPTASHCPPIHKPTTMASIKMTPPTEIYVVIAHTTYDLSASPLNMYTDRRAAEEHARIAGVEVQVYLRHGYASPPMRDLCIC